MEPLQKPMGQPLFLCQLQYSDRSVRRQDVVTNRLLQMMKRGVPSKAGPCRVPTQQSQWQGSPEGAP